MRRKPVEITQVCREQKVTGGNNFGEWSANRKFVSLTFLVQSEITEVGPLRS